MLTEHRIAGGARALAWSADGSRLAVASLRQVELFGPGTAHLVVPLPGVRALSFARDGRLALLRAGTVAVYNGSERAQTVFGVRGRLSGIAWSPNGRWLVTSLPAADQWIFLGERPVQAVSHIAQQFGGAVSLDGWVPGP